jgi:chaperonin cofactor prefoldin
VPDAENNQELRDSQDLGSQKMQKPPPKAMLQENDRLKEQLKQRDDQTARLMGQIDLLLKQQAESSKQLTHRDEQLELQRREMKQENDELKDRINQLMDLFFCSKQKVANSMLYPRLK